MKTIKERIREHIENKDWDYKFDWHGERWGAKYETIKSLSRALKSPATSLYVPVRQLVKDGFIRYSDKLISTESRIELPAVQECDATKLNQGNTADNQK